MSLRTKKIGKKLAVTASTGYYQVKWVKNYVIRIEGKI